jgi:hypothetical protein
MGLSEPLRAAGLANPNGQGVVVERFGFMFSVGIARKAAEDSIRSDRGVRRKDSDLQVAEFVRGQLAVFEEDESGIQGLNRAIHLDVVRGEEAADGIEIALGERGPQVLLLVDDFDGSERRCSGLRLCNGEWGDRENEKKAAHGDYANSCLLVEVKESVGGRQPRRTRFGDGHGVNQLTETCFNRSQFRLACPMVPAGLAFYVRDWRDT